MYSCYTVRKRTIDIAKSAELSREVGVGWGVNILHLHSRNTIGLPPPPPYPPEFFS